MLNRIILILMHAWSQVVTICPLISDLFLFSLSFFFTIYNINFQGADSTWPNKHFRVEERYSLVRLVLPNTEELISRCFVEVVNKVGSEAMPKKSKVPGCQTVLEQQSDLV